MGGDLGGTLGGWRGGEGGGREEKAVAAAAREVRRSA